MIIKIEITNWEKYNPRKSIKNPRWFALSNKLLRDPDFYGFSSDELLVWISCLSLASEQNSKTIDFDTNYLTAYRGYPESVQISAIKKLCKNKVVSQIRSRRVHGVLHYTTLQDNTEPPTPLPGGVPPSSVPIQNPEALMTTWNLNRGSLPQVLELNAVRLRKSKARLKEVPDLSVWESVVKKLAASDFCTGKNSKWVATFDFLLQPGTRTKALEGNYDNRSGKPQQKFDTINTWEHD